MLFYNEYAACSMIAYSEYDPALCCEPLTFTDLKNALTIFWTWVTNKPLPQVECTAS